MFCPSRKVFHRRRKIGLNTNKVQISLCPVCVCVYGNIFGYIIRIHVSVVYAMAIKVGKTPRVRVIAVFDGNKPKLWLKTHESPFLTTTAAYRGRLLITTTTTTTTTATSYHYYTVVVNPCTPVRFYRRRYSVLSPWRLLSVRFAKLLTTFNLKTTNF